MIKVYLLHLETHLRLVHKLLFFPLFLLCNNLSFIPLKKNKLRRFLLVLLTYQT